MSKLAKAKNRLRQKPKDYTWSEATALLEALGFDSYEGSGSRVKFVHPDKGLINLHKPHPDKVMKRYAVIELYKFLESKGLLK